MEDRFEIEGERIERARIPPYPMWTTLLVVQIRKGSMGAQSPPALPAHQLSRVGRGWD